MEDKLTLLKTRLKEYKSAVIAFSGGVDSTFLARLEFIPSEMDKAWGIKSKLTEICKKSGFSYITIDLTGYRTGSMNEVLSELDKKDYQKKPLNNY